MIKEVILAQIYLNLALTANAVDRGFEKDNFTSVNSDESLFNEVIDVVKKLKGYTTGGHKDGSKDKGFKNTSKYKYHQSHNSQMPIVSRSTTRKPDIEKLMHNLKSIFKPTENMTSYNCAQSKLRESSEENARKSTLFNYPYSVSIQKKGAHYTTGALVSHQAVLTVAGEFYNVRESIKLFRARMGSVDCKQRGTLMPIKLIDTHPLYKPGKPAFDIAVLKLARKVIISENIAPIALSKVQQKVLSAKFLTTYWPRLIVHGEVLLKTARERMKPYSLRVSTQKLIPREHCSKMMKSRGQELNENSLCLKPIVPHHSNCIPDAGAPVVADDGLWGITSGWISEKCHLHPSPTIVTRLSLKAVRQWLQNLL